MKRTAILALMAIGITLVVLIRNKVQSDKQEDKANAPATESEDRQQLARANQRDPRDGNFFKIADLIEAGWKLQADRIGATAAEGEVSASVGWS